VSTCSLPQLNKLLNGALGWALGLQQKVHVSVQHGDQNPEQRLNPGKQVIQDGVADRAPDNGWQLWQ
jgi:hypothetical protein